jgi:hypothetical protein
VRRQSYRFAHALLPDPVRLRLRRIVRSEEREQRLAAERAARQREKELRVALKDKVSAARAARSRSQRP